MKIVSASNSWQSSSAVITLPIHEKKSSGHRMTISVSSPFPQYSSAHLLLSTALRTWQRVGAGGLWEQLGACWGNRGGSSARGQLAGLQGLGPALPHVHVALICHSSCAVLACGVAAIAVRSPDHHRFCMVQGFGGNVKAHGKPSSLCSDEVLTWS